MSKYIPYSFTNGQKKCVDKSTHFNFILFINKIYRQYLTPLLFLIP